MKVVRVAWPFGHATRTTFNPLTFNLQPSTFNLQPTNLQPSTFNFQPSTH
ncbi:hypothetical protein [Moorena sp. SIO1F2]|nr:hypothetical protein [Moorena sp. SIO1F2]